jgi:hypothetical protein
MGVIEGQQVLSGNAWEEVKKGGDNAVRTWINEQMKGRSCVVVLVGNATAGRKWINYEIKKAWDEGRGLVGVHIHNLKNLAGEQSSKGSNPFVGFTVGDQSLSSIAEVFDPPYSTSTSVYSHIQEHLEAWVEEAIEIRKGYT